jgi:hypothetical protein
MKSEKIARAFEKNSILSQKTVKTPFFFDFLDFQARGADICAPDFKKLVEQKLFAIIKGYFFRTSR